MQCTTPIEILHGVKQMNKQAGKKIYRKHVKTDESTMMAYFL